jgi:hypothetical protein
MPNEESVTTYTTSHTYAQTQPDRRSDTQAHISPHTQTQTPRTHAHTLGAQGKVQRTLRRELTASTLDGMSPRRSPTYRPRTRIVRCRSALQQCELLRGRERKAGPPTDNRRGVNRYRRPLSPPGNPPHSVPDEQRRPPLRGGLRPADRGKCLSTLSSNETSQLTSRLASDIPARIPPRLTHCLPPPLPLPMPSLLATNCPIRPP